MAFDIVSYPDAPVPKAKNRLMRFRIATDEHIIDDGQVAIFSCEFAGGNPDGQTFTVFGLVITTDSSVPHTATTIDASGTAAQAADNFFGWVKRQWQFFEADVEFGPLYTVVYVSWKIRMTFPAADWVFSNGTMLPVVTMSSQNGLPIILKPNFHIQYGFYHYEDGFYNLLKSGHLKAKINTKFDDPYLPVVIDAQQEIARQLSTKLPTTFNANPTAPEPDTQFMKTFEMRAGAVSVVDCQPVYSQLYFAPYFRAMNAVCQPNELFALNFYGPFFGTAVKWLSTRPSCFPVFIGERDWLWILIEQNWLFVYPDWQVWYVFHKFDGTVVTKIISFTQSVPAVMTFKTGPGNVATPAGTTWAQVDYYDVIIFGLIDDGSGGTFYNIYSEPKHYRVNQSACPEVEFYFIEEKGGVGTLKMRELSQIQHERTATATENYHEIELPTARAQFYNTGGRSKNIVNARNRYFVEHGPVPPGCDVKDYFRQFLDSPLHWIFFEWEEGRIFRRVIIDNETAVIFQEGESVNLKFSYIFSDDLATQ